jgi:phosphoglucomutase
MMEAKVDETILERAQLWLDGAYDDETKAQVMELLKNPTELTDSFYRDLEFGTGGLRGLMGAGTNRMNRYTVGMATQGLANYLKKMFAGTVPLKVAISFDSRNNSRDFARVCSEVLSGNGFQVFLFDDIRPTPVLSFTIRHLQCQSGIMITASHNPKEYNGYKAYWDDGAQMVAPHDTGVIDEVKKITNIADVKWDGPKENIRLIGEEIDALYIKRTTELSLNPDTIRRQKNLKIVYTPLHGTGRKLVPALLEKYGFTNVTIIKEQAVADGNFPTLRSPNPEEHDAMDMALKQAKEIDADLVMATDPDADRVGIAVKDHKGEFVLLNGNQTAALLFYYVLSQWQEKKMLTGKEFIVTTIVTTELLKAIAGKFGVECFDVLTGFKFIAEVIRENEGKKTFIIGGEESYGYLIGDFVRDKDAVSACAMIAETAAFMADRNRTLFDLLLNIYKDFAFYKEQLFSLTKKGKKGAEEIMDLMVNYREHPFTSINNSKVLKIKDYKVLKEKDVITGKEKTIHLPSSDVLQFILEDGSKISVRPSGTEPKIKYYFGVCEKLVNTGEFDKIDGVLDSKIGNIIASMHLE